MWVPSPIGVAALLFARPHDLPWMNMVLEIAQWDAFPLHPHLTDAILTPLNTALHPSSPDVQEEGAHRSLHRGGNLERPLSSHQPAHALRFVSISQVPQGYERGG